MEIDDAPTTDEDFVESCLIRWGLAGFVAGLGMIYGLLYCLWRYALSFFYPGA